MPRGFPFELPESVEHYLSDKAISEAVGHLTGMRDDHVPEGLELPELGKFYEARSAAELVRSQYPIAQFKFWDHVWGSDLPSAWLPLPVQEMGADAIGPRTIWNDGAIALVHRGMGLTLYTLAGFTPSTTTIGFSVEDADGHFSYDQDVPPFVWHEDEWEDYLIKDWPVTITDEKFPWSELYEVRNQALELITFAGR